MKNDAIILSRQEVRDARDRYVGTMVHRESGFSCLFGYEDYCEESQDEGICRLCKRLTQFIGGPSSMDLAVSRKEVEEFYEDRCVGEDGKTCESFGEFYGCWLNNSETETPADGECALCKRIEDFAREGRGEEDEG